MSIDCIIKNGRVYSVDMAGMVSRNEAVAIKDGIITAVGNNEDIGKLATIDTKIIDAEGCSVMPGFSDAHLHASFSASAMFSCNLFEVVADETYNREKLIKEYQQKMKIYMENHKDDKIIRGTGWNIGYFGTQLPTRHDLDEICPDKPMVLESFCQHHLWVNTKAIEMSGITKNTPTPRAGEITREENGYPAGIFSEFTALAMIKENLKGYDFSVEEYKETLRIYQREFANKYGVTLIFDAYCSENGREAYKELARNPDPYKGKSLTYSGKVIQVIEGDTETQHRIAVNGDYDNVIYVAYPKNIVTSRILDDDYVTVYGTSLGLYSYQSTMGGKITVPALYLDRIELQQ